MSPEFVQAVSMLFSAIAGLAVLVTGYTLARKFLRKAGFEGGGSIGSAERDYKPSGYVLTPDGSRWESAEKSHRRYLWHEENNVGGYHKKTGARLR